ncbi:MAG: hydantoinase B/oxoprolinase family protein [Cyanobacteria bacterium J06629_9]
MADVAPARWQFWIDRGGTFTDVVAQRPDGQLVIHKLLSSNPQRYSDAPLQGMRELMGISESEPLPAEQIDAIKMGTTVATNALLERQGARTVLVITQGFRDALRIGYQNRPDIFARHIVLPDMLYETVVEVPERLSAQGEVLQPLTREALAELRQQLQAIYEAGIQSCAIALVHGYRYPDHEQQLAAVAQAVGFDQVSVSHQVSSLMKLVSRGDTTVADAYLSPVLKRYIAQVEQVLARGTEAAKPRLMFMQSNGGLTDAELFQGKDSIFSGPAGGVVGAVKTCQQVGYNQIIGFDMGGTSTDVSHFAGEYERTFETEVAGVRLRAPMMAIHTVAAGGGSILSFDGARYRVGPASAGAYPGPACYRNGGPLTVTDANVMLGKLQPEFFPHVFGESGNLPIDGAIVRQRFSTLAKQIERETGIVQSAVEVASGYVAIAVEKMAQAIKKISVQRGYDLADYALCCFGSAGGQHACLIAEALGIPEIYIHPYAGVLSAYGMGLADLRSLQERSVEQPLTETTLPEIEQTLQQLALAGKAEMQQQGIPFPGGLTPLAETERVSVIPQVHLRYIGTDSTIAVPFGSVAAIQAAFEAIHRQRYGFIQSDRELVVATAAVEVVGHQPEPTLLQPSSSRSSPLQSMQTVSVFMAGSWQTTAVYLREDLVVGDQIIGPALILEATGTNVIEPGWQVTLGNQGGLIFRQRQVSPTQQFGDRDDLATPDPIRLEIFNNLFRAIAEEMGVTLQNTSYSVNIKERLDFSCALFNAWGELVANAPHIPVHLGSMGESVQSLIQVKGDDFQPGDVYAINNPYNGGTHLPDITVITPVWVAENTAPAFYAASRGHHADIGGISPGSMPADSTDISEEGILFDHLLLVNEGQFRDEAVRSQLTEATYPALNPDQNIADLQAQIAANAKGVQELHKLVGRYGLKTVNAYMQHVQDNAEACVRRAIQKLGQRSQSVRSFTYPMDNGSQIQVQVALDVQTGSAKVDFTGTSPQQPNNFNAPLAVCKAAVLYVFRTLIEDDIPLNAGCLKPVTLVVPSDALLNPSPPAAVVAGNVETSQAITNALYGALGVMAASQGTMNNFTFGNARYQYYETICGGSGAGPDFDGTDAVHTHMTNSRLTDPEVLEWRFPVLLERFEILAGSGGEGQHRGGNGVIRQLQFREPMTVSLLSGHRQIPPFGLAGGEAGAVGQNTALFSSGEKQALPGTAKILLSTGDRLVIETPGGGGYGQA